MPDWKYVVKRVRFGKAQRLRFFEQIRRLVRDAELGLQIPMIKRERNPGREFYFGLATDFPNYDGDQPPESVMEILCDQLGLPRSETYWVPAEEVKAFLPATVGFDSFVDPIKFEEKDGQEREKEAWDIEGWFRSRLTGEIEEKSLEPPDNREAYDQLLWLCSAMGNGSYKKFHDVCEALGLSQEKNDSYRILRNLSLLGHLEARKDSRGSWRWSLAPALAVSCANGEEKFLAGQRVKRMEEKLAEVAPLERRDLQLGPTNLRFEAVADQSLDLGDGWEVEDAGCVSQRLAEALPSVDVFAQNHLREDRNISPTSYEFERFDGNEFVSTTPGNLEEGLYEVMPSEGEHYPRKRLLDAAGIWRSGGYYDLRFVSLDSTGEKPVAAYDAKQSRLVMPARYHWPTIYEKALVLAEGLLPEWKSNKNGPDLYYQGVSEELATILCEKLNVELGSIG